VVVVVVVTAKGRERFCLYLPHQQAAEAMNETSTENRKDAEMKAWFTSTCGYKLQIYKNKFNN